MRACARGTALPPLRAAGALARAGEEISGARAAASLLHGVGHVGAVAVP